MTEARTEPAIGVTFRLFAAARAAAGRAEVQVAAGPVRSAVAALLEGRPARLAEVLAVCTLLADGRRLDPTGDEPLPPGCVVDVLPPFAGG
jgi:molybdopterin converting factor small subunit